MSRPIFHPVPQGQTVDMLEAAANVARFLAEAVPQAFEGEASPGFSEKAALGLRHILKDLESTIEEATLSCRIHG